MKKEPVSFTGLTEQEVIQSRISSGSNVIRQGKSKALLSLLGEVFTEPMFIFLSVTCAIYLLLGEFREGIIMLMAMFFIASISFFQERRTSKALNVLRKMNQPKSKVIRNGIQEEISSEEIVVNDILLIEEGEQIPSDGIILEAHDLSIDESILTGESFAVLKNTFPGNNQVYMGATVKTGSAIVKITTVGNATFLSRIGKSVEELEPGPSRFHQEIKSFITRMSAAGIIAFILVLLINYFKSYDFLPSLLFALTIAMSILPEEIPVAFSTFMAMGSWKLLKEEVLVKDPQTIETLGAATIICIDKTGTLTENKMAVSKIYCFKDNIIYNISALPVQAYPVIQWAMWASEPVPFDPMETAIHEAYQKTVRDERKDFAFVHEYPLAGTPPVMTHIYENQRGQRIIACKGGPESVITYARLNDKDTSAVLDKVKELTTQGYRVLGVGSAHHGGGAFPEDQKDFPWVFEGLIALYDPPRKNISEVLQKFYKAGIQVKILSGDYPETTRAIAREIGFHETEKTVTGQEIMEMSESALKKMARERTIFARMYPEAKLKVVTALRSMGEVVAMTGDGVNDGMALKAADIGVAMGRRGTEIARRAAAMVLLNDDLDKMFHAVIAGRKININLKKAIRYIISIHIPIILTVLVPLLLDWEIVNIFSPLHIIFFELIMGPTCSIIYENEPIESSLLQKKPVSTTQHFLSLRELSMSIIQGLVITLGVLMLYYYISTQTHSAEMVRTMVFINIITANIFLTLVNRSFTDSILKTFSYSNPLIWLMISLTLFLLIAILAISPVRELFLLSPLNTHYLVAVIVSAFFTVFWIEGYKLLKYKS